MDEIYGPACNPAVAGLPTLRRGGPSAWLRRAAGFIKPWGRPTFPGNFNCTTKRYRKGPRIYIRADSIERFRTLVCPHFHTSMRDKLQYENIYNYIQCYLKVSDHPSNLLSIAPSYIQTSKPIKCQSLFALVLIYIFAKFRCTLICKISSLFMPKFI